MSFSLSFLDFFGALISLVTTYFYVRANPLAWKLGIIATTLNTLLYVNQGIYGQATLEAVYFISMWYGLTQWQRNKSQAAPITSISFSHGAILVMLGAVMIPLATFLLGTTTRNELAFWDATICVLSLIAQWLLCRKIIQNWLIWFAVDTVIIVMHYYKGIPFHAVMHLVYLVFAVAGYISWQKSLKADTEQVSPHTTAIAPEASASLVGH